MPSSVMRAGLGWSLLAAACTTPVASGLSEPEANAVLVALEESGVAGEKSVDPSREGAFRVSVARGEESRAVLALSRHGLPREPSPGILESLGQGSLVPSRSAEHAKLVAGTAGELERSLGGVEGVLGVRVHLAVPTADRLLPGEVPRPPSASVLLRHRGATPPLAPAEVQRLVAGAVPGLDVAQVAVVTTPTPAGAAPPERELTRVGPITVARGSVGTLRFVLAAAALLNVGLVLAVGLLWWKLRDLRARLEGTGEGAEGPS